MAMGVVFGYINHEQLHMAREKAALVGGAFGAFCGVSLVGVSMFLVSTLRAAPEGFMRAGTAIITPAFWYMAFLVAFIGLFVTNIIASASSIGPKETLDYVDLKVVYTPIYMISIREWADAFSRVWMTYAVVAGIMMTFVLLTMLGLSREEMRGKSTEDARELLTMFVGFGLLAFPPTFVLAANIALIAVPVALIWFFVTGTIRWLSGAESFFYTLHDRPIMSALVYCFVGGASGTWIATDASIKDLHFSGYAIPAIYIGIFGGAVVMWILSEVINGLFRRTSATLVDA